MRATCSSAAGTLHPMPPACARLLRTLPGNDECIDCGARHPEWATVSYGALICLECSGRHRRLGVQVRAFEHCVTLANSRVTLLTIYFLSCLNRLPLFVPSSWIIGHKNKSLSLLEGGNFQLAQFFARHDMKDIPDRRYKTKAARFYRENLGKHAQQVKGLGFYPGREASRRTARTTETLRDCIKTKRLCCLLYTTTEVDMPWKEHESMFAAL